MKVAVVDDDEAVLHSMRLLLENRGLSVCCYDSAEKLLAEIGEQIPSCVVSDVRMPGLTGLELQKQLSRSHASVPLILITGHGDIAMAVHAIKEGAFDFIEKPFDDERLVRSIEHAVERGSQLRAAEDEVAAIRAGYEELSPRQREVMHLVVQGLANKEIARELNLSPRTVESYRAWAMEKMGAVNLADLVRKVMTLKERSGMA